MKLTGIERISKGRGWTIAIDNGFACYKFNLRVGGSYSIMGLAEDLKTALDKIKKIKKIISPK